MTPVTFLESFPLRHVIVVGAVFAAGAFVEVDGAFLELVEGVASWNNFTLIVGFENVKPAADKSKKPPESLITVVATFEDPSMFITETVALIGAVEKP